MSTPISQFPKPEAEQYKGQRKLFLVPNFTLSPQAPEEGLQLLDRYWSELREHIQNLERSLEPVSHLYHEAVYEEGETGLKLAEVFNPKGYPFIQALCTSTAKLEALENRELIEEHSDWQRCLSIGLISPKVLNIALDGFKDITQRRFEHMATRIDDTLKEGESGILFIREDHRIQFHSDIRVFYVAPPALDALKRWIDDQIRLASQVPQEPQQSQGQ